MTDKTPLILKLGVLDVPYSDGNGETTGDVAGYLENGYGIMEYFWDTYGDRFSDQLIDAMEGAAESLAMGAPPTHDPYGTATSAMEEAFRDMLTNKGMDGKVAGVPTAAAQKGYSKRFKKKGKKREPRPSFIDTGMYQANMRAWVGDDDE